MTRMQTLAAPAPAFEALWAWLDGLRYEAVPAASRDFAQLLILDLVGVAAGASKMRSGRIARDHAVRHWAAGDGAPAARLLFDGRQTSLPGFGFAMATQIDNLDAHDGWQPSKGHGGAALFPALAAFAQAMPDGLSGRDAIAAMVAGYEIAYRAADALHKTVADYHTSGAWNALGCAAIGAKLRGSGADALRHALGIAEYHGPRSQMMREIANPTMLHDGTGFGAPVGIYALLIAEDGFEGAPAATVEFEDAAFAWEDLGRRWLTAEQYIKPYPTCRWAHAAIDGALDLRDAHGLSAEGIAAVEIRSFRYATDLWGQVPTSTSQAQYALAWPVAAALARGRVGVDEILEDSFGDAEIGALIAKTRAVPDPEIEGSYPDRRLARVIVTTTAGETLDSGLREASGGPDPLPGRTEVIAKFRALAGAALCAEDVAEAEALILGLDASEACFKSAMLRLAEMMPAQ
jgi:2-methylcitrate dehydratase PrpD